MCSWYEVEGELLPKHWPSKNTDLLQSEKGEYVISQFQLRMSETVLVGNFETAYWTAAKNQIFLNYFHSKVFFLILVQVCFTFPKHVTIIECLCKYSNHCLFSRIWNIFLILLRTYLLENNGRNIVLCVKMLLWKKNRMC